MKYHEVSQTDQLSIFCSVCVLIHSMYPLATNTAIEHGSCMDDFNMICKFNMAVHGYLKLPEGNSPKDGDFILMGSTYRWRFYSWEIMCVNG